MGDPAAEEGREAEGKGGNKRGKEGGGEGGRRRGREGGKEGGLIMPDLTKLSSEL